MHEIPAKVRKDTIEIQNSLCYNAKEIVCPCYQKRSVHNMKLFYEEAELSIVLFDVEDIITTSSEIPTKTTDDDADEIIDSTVTTEPDDDELPSETTGSDTPGSGDGSNGDDNVPNTTDAPDDVVTPDDPAPSDPVPDDPADTTGTTGVEDTTVATTAPPMSNAGAAGWDDGDHIDFSDLLG